MVSSVGQLFSVSRGKYWHARCKRSKKNFTRYGKKHKSFYLSIMRNHLRICYLDYDAWRGHQETRPNKRKKKIRSGESNIEENEKMHPCSSPTRNKEHKKSKDCIKCEDQWFTPYAFEEFAGKAGFAGSCKKWKMTIFHKTKPLQYWFENGFLFTKGFKRRSQEHQQVTTDLPRDSISEHLSDSNSARTAASIAVEHSRVSRSSASDGQSDTITMETNDTAQGGRAETWYQPLDVDLLMEEDCLPRHGPPSPGAKDLKVLLGQDVAREVELTPEREEGEVEEMQDDTGSESSTSFITAPVVTESKATMTALCNQVKNENTDAQHVRALSFDSDVEISLAPPPTPSIGCDLDTMGLDQLKREKLKMQIKVLRLQEEYYIRSLSGTLK